MADSNGNGGIGALYFIVGALCVAVVVGAFVLSGGLPESSSSQAQAPAASSAPAPAAPTTTKNITIEKKTVEPERKVIIERH